MKSINKVINDKQNNLNTAVLPTASTKHQDMNRQRTEPDKQNQNPKIQLNNQHDYDLLHNATYNLIQYHKTI